MPPLPPSPRLHPNFDFVEKHGQQNDLPMDNEAGREYDSGGDFVLRASVAKSIVLIAAALVVLLSVDAQQTTPAPKNAASPALPATPHRKRTAEQEHGLALLKTAEAEAGGLQADMRAFVLWQAARAYAGFDPAKVAALMRQAFQVTLSIENPVDDPNCARGEFCVKGWLQDSILSDILKKDVKEAEELLSSAEVSIRAGVTAKLVDYYIGKKIFSRAQELLTRIADGSDYPFEAATKLVKALPKGNSADRLALFTQAQNNFEQHGSKEAPFSADFGNMITGVWEQLPANVMLGAIDKVLEEAKEHKATDQMQVSLAAKGGDSANLNSMYELRLFQMLPILRELDSSRAEVLLRDNAAARANLKRFPNGIATPDSIYFHTGDAPSNEMQMNQQALVQLRQRTEQLVEEAEKDPQQALSDALTLPVSDGHHPGLSCARLEALEAIARKTAKKNPKGAKAALDEALKLADQLSPQQGMAFTDVPELYLAIGDKEAAKTALKSLSKIAERVYSQDTNPDDPNLAFKGVWPSSRLWRSGVQTAEKVSAELAAEIIAAIPDEDISAFQNITYASSLLNAPTFPATWAERHKNGISMVQMQGPTEQ
jgi:hypothetical protein